MALCYLLGSLLLATANTSASAAGARPSVTPQSVTQLSTVQVSTSQISTPQLSTQQLGTEAAAALLQPLTGQPFSVPLQQLQQALTAEPPTSADLEQALQQLRLWSYARPLSEVRDPELTRLAALLDKLAQLPLFLAADDQAARLQEQFAVLSYRYYPADALTTQRAVQLRRLSNLLQSTASTGTQNTRPSLADQYRELELLRALGFLAYQGRHDDASKTQWQAMGPLREYLLQALQGSTGWQLEHQLWLLAYQQLLLDEKPQQQLDNAVWQALGANQQLNLAERQRLFSQRYLVNSFRTRESCEKDFAGQCQLIEPTTVLTRQHDCDASLRIRHQDLSAAELAQSCQLMQAQTTRFHQLLGTGQQPVANDLNQRLEVMIFPDYSAYNLAGSLAFDIQTNNGGMYIEGTPSDPANQARFFSFRQFWQASPFAVWNLAHEYVHYLDGRFNLYGAFAHFPGQTVWWSEGLAELISKGEHNPQALQLLYDSRPSAAATATVAGEAGVSGQSGNGNTHVKKRPTLAQIFATDYEQSQEQIYRWSYLAWRYFETAAPALLPKLAAPLRGDFAGGYQQLLADTATAHQAAFSRFLAELTPETDPAKAGVSGNANSAQGADVSKAEKARPAWQPRGRYLYRSYLQPAHLPVDSQHFHLLQLPQALP